MSFIQYIGGGGGGGDGPMVSALDSASSGPGSRPGWGHCVVFFGQETLDNSLYQAKVVSYFN